MAQVRTPRRLLLAQWCGHCDTQHEGQLCPGRLTPVEPERHGWRINVDTDAGIEAYGVLVARCSEGWRGRILTYPNVLWLVPGGKTSLKFTASTAREAELKASNYITAHCESRGFQRRKELSKAVFHGVDAEGALPTGFGDGPAQRKIRFLPVRFGVGLATEPGGIGNLSSTGLFVITRSPLNSGKRIAVSLRLDDERTVTMTGRVAWMNPMYQAGRSPGMGIKLDTPPEDYLGYVQKLP